MAGAPVLGGGEVVGVAQAQVGPLAARRPTARALQHAFESLA